MFWLKKQSDTEKKLSQMQNLLMRSFSNVKMDTQKIFQWLNHINQKSMAQENQIKQLQLELSYIPKKPEDIRKIVDTYYSFDNMMERIKMINDKVDGMIATKSTSAYKAIPEMQEIQARVGHLEDQKKATIREKVVKRVTKNSKEYVKSLILSYIRKYTQVSSQQLKEMIVYDQALCSKSSFYRLLDELEALDEIGTARKGRQKYYLFKQIKQH